MKKVFFYFCILFGVVLFQQVSWADEISLKQSPITIDEIMVVVNIRGVTSGQIKMDPVVLSDIYLGKITQWRDKAITNLNPGVMLPNSPIHVVRRGDYSDTTYIFTKYLDKVSKDWHDKVGFGDSVNWPVGLSAKGNYGVATYVGRIKNSIGYVDLAFALKENLTMKNLTYVKLQTRDKILTEPTIDGFSVATGRHTDSVMTASIHNGPPNLKIAALKLIEPSDNGILDAGEQGRLTVVLRNAGKGSAFGVSLALQADKALKGLRLNEKVYIGQINPGEEKTVEADITALEDIQSADLNVKATLVESNGFDSQPLIISFRTKELIPPLLQVAKVDIEDADGRRVIAKGNEARVTLTVQNAGEGASRGVVITAEPGDANIKLFGDSTVEIGDLSSGESKKAIFSVAVTTRYSGPKELPLHFTIKEERDRFSVNPDIKFALNEEASEVRVVKVEAKETPTARLENIEDINTPPAFNEESKIMGDKDVAIVIGIERYRKLPRAEYSYNDAKAVKGYLKAMGFAERNIKFLVDEEATLSGINSSIGTWLPNRIKKESRVFIYYSGHGSPDPVSGEAYLMPHDGDPNYLKDTGYPLKRLYESLGKLDAAEVAVVMDSCFSGSGGRSVLAKGARPAVVVIEDPVLASKNIAVLSSTQGAQISTSFTEKEHGLFTYYFLKAVKEGKKDLAEIYSYIKPLVEDEARAQNVEQSPSLKPGPELVKDRFGLRR